MTCVVIAQNYVGVRILNCQWDSKDMFQHFKWKGGLFLMSVLLYLYRYFGYDHSTFSLPATDGQIPSQNTDPLGHGFKTQTVRL